MPDVFLIARCDEATARSVARTLDTALEDIGTAYSVFEVGPDTWDVSVYPAGDDREAVVKIIANALPDLSFEERDLPDENWVARSLEGLKPVRAGRFVVHGAHDREAVTAHNVAIEIEAGEAFGTGHHATTASCLLAIEKQLQRGTPGRVLDVGTGSGVLAIAIAKRCPARIVATDIDPVAVRTARENARANGVFPRIRFARADGLEHPLIAASSPYHLIVANILAEPLRSLAPSIARNVRREGTVILSGILNRQELSVLAAYRRYDLVPRQIIRQEGWSILTLSRP